ncbi:MAG TPA: PH domain-containing protein [Anaerolineaceae bacterium]|nr:PH domain-containing protein [Anaerolineaceae bacterium]
METTYAPDRRKGLRVIFSLAGLIALLIIFLIFRSTIETDATFFLVWVVAGVFLLIPLALLLYRAYALITTSYTLTQNSLELRWGLRRELIPLNQIEWARPLSDFQSQLPLPWFRLPGSIFTARNIKGLGTVQFISTDSAKVVLVHTEPQTFVISPRDLTGFAQQFNRYAELGQRDITQAVSETLKSVWTETWRDQRARTLIRVGLVMVGVTWLTAIGVMAVFPEIIWVDLTTVPSSRLILLALLASLVWLGDLWTGLFFYLRGTVIKLLIYCIWGASILTSTILIAAIFLLAV